MHALTRVFKNRTSFCFQIQTISVNMIYLNFRIRGKGIINLI